MREWRARQPLLFDTAVAHGVLFVVCVVLALVDPTLVTGVNRWIKPIKFTSSVGIYLLTLAWLWPVAVAGVNAKRRAAWVLAGTMLFEIVVILVQAGRGVRSHFNTDTAMDAAVFQLMGVAIVMNIVTAAVVCRWTFRAAPSAYVWGVRLGLLLFVVFALEGGIMAQRLAHAVGAPDDGPGLPLLNWSRNGGDLRVAHFVGMHALQGLPLVGYVTRSIPAIAAAFAVWSALSIAALWHALAGMPLAMG
jgi:hypothetical protein